MSGRIEQMRQELISNGVKPEIVNNMSEKQLEAACKERNIQIQSGLNNNANWGNVEDGFERNAEEEKGKEYELRPMTDEEKGQLRQTGVVPFIGKGGALAKALIETVINGVGAAYVGYQFGAQLRELQNIKESENQSQNSQDSNVINEVTDALKKEEE